MYAIMTRRRSAVSEPGARSRAAVTAGTSQSIRYKVLVVEDDADAREILSEHLRREGFTVAAAQGAREALLQAVDWRPDLMVSDVAMPETDGFQLCRALRADARTAGIPVILISGSKTALEDQIEGMGEGADDYLVKPYSPSLLVAKIRAVLRRYSFPPELQERLRVAGLELDGASRKVRARGREIYLTRKEFDLLALLLRKPGRVLSVPYLLETVWGYDPAQYNEPRTIQVHVSTLRRKLGRSLGSRIVNVPALGYRFDL